MESFKELQSSLIGQATESAHLHGGTYDTLTLLTWASVGSYVCLGICVLCERAGPAKPTEPVGGFMRGK